MITLGIDISQNTLDCCLLVHNEPVFYSYQNSIDGFSQILQLHKDSAVSLLGFESTGNYHKKLEKYLFENGINPFILRPIAIANFRKVIKVKGKTDKIDSFAIANFLIYGDISEYLSFPVRDLFKPILSSLTLMDKQIRQTKNLIHSLSLCPETDKTSNILNEVEISLNCLITSKTKLETNSISLLYSLSPESLKVKNDIDGVGDKLMLYLMPLLIDNFDKYTLKQINSFFGLNPVSYQSGTSVYKKDR